MPKDSYGRKTSYNKLKKQPAKKAKKMAKKKGY